MEHFLLQFLTQKNAFIFYAMPLTMAVELHFSETINLGKWNFVSANSQLFSTAKFRLSTFYMNIQQSFMHFRNTNFSFRDHNIV